MKLSTLTLKKILGISVLLNLIAAIFSNGYFAHDDHFLIIEASKSWAEGFDYNHWLPWNQQGEVSAEGHSFFYVGIYYCFFTIVEYLGINDPSIQIKISQILQAIFMVSITYFGFKLIKAIYSHKIAVYSSLLLCSFYFFPFFSSRTLVEFFCVPFLFSAAYFIQKYNKNKNLKLLLLAGILLGLAFNIRFQTGAFAIGFAIYFILHRNLKGVILLTVGGLIGVSTVQGLVDYIIWGKPFMELVAYVEYNIAHKTSYFDEPWFKYILFVIPGFLIPPFGIFLYLGFFKNYKNYAYIILATSSFILFHTYFPNKQERFIIPALPFIILIGGAYFFNTYNRFKSKYINKLAKGSFYFFIIINTIAGIILSFTYSKKSRVESMLYLKSKKAKIIIREDSERGKFDLIPLFYADNFSLKTIKWTAESDRTDFAFSNIVNKNPEYILFYGDKNIQERITNAENILGELSLEKEIRPSMVDNIAYVLNPKHNTNRIVTIYKIATPLKTR